MLYKVKITRTICVVAENDQDAKALACRLKNADDCGEDDFSAVHEVNTVDDIPPNWRGCVPYAIRGKPLTMEEHVALKGASTTGA